MRPRDFGRVASTRYDLLVIGGGISGLAIACDAATRGLLTALVDASDFGSGSSFTHQQTVHGGLPALQRGRIGRARRAVRERRALARAAPWLLRPLPFIVGTYRSVTRSRVALRAAFRIDTWIGRHRNDGVEPELHLPAARLVSKAATLRLFPGVRRDGLTGGAQWYDYQVVESDRLTIALAAAADRAGAALANYVEALSAIRDNGRIAGMRVRDVLSGEETDIRAGLVVNAAGANAGRIMRCFGVDRPVPLGRTMALLTSKHASDIALAAPATNGQWLTLVPWRGRAVVGTSQSSIQVQPETAGIAESDVEAFIAQANQAFPALSLVRRDVTLVRAGIVPAMIDRNGSLDVLPAPKLLDHASDGVDGAVTVIGAQYATARAAARRVVTLAGRKLGRRLGTPRSASPVLPGAGIADHEALAIETARAHGLELPLPLIRHLIGRYAEHAAEIVRLMAADARLRDPLGADGPNVAAEVAYVIRGEMALRLTDVLIRRLGVGAAGHPGAAVVRSAAAVAASELGWDADRVSAEIAEVDRFYELR